MKNFSVLVKQVLMSTLTAGMFAFSFSSCSDDFDEFGAMDGNATRGESFELTSLEQYSYTVPVQVNVQGDWEIDLKFKDDNHFCYALPAKGHGPAIIKLCMLDNWTENRNEAQMVIRDLDNNQEVQSFRLMQKCNLDNPALARTRTRGGDGEGEEGGEAAAAQEYSQGLRTKAVGYGYNVTKESGVGAVTLNPIIALEKLAASGNNAGAKTSGCNVAKNLQTVSGSSYDELFSNVTTKAEGKATKGGLAAELKASYTHEQKSTNEFMYVFTTLDCNITHAYLSGIDHNNAREYLTDNARKAIDGEGVYTTSDEGFALLLRDYGSHLILQSDLGGHIRYSSVVKKSTTESKDEATAFAQCSYKNQIVESASASVDATITKKYNSNKDCVNTQVRAYGGNATLAMKADKTQESIDAWMESLNKFEGLAAVGVGNDPGSLMPLYDLVDTSTEKGRQRRERMKAYLESGMAEVMAYDGTESAITRDVFHFSIPQELLSANGYEANHTGTLVYEAWANNKVVAMICKEYMPQISNMGLVLTVYPVTDNKPDFKNGRFLGNDLRPASRVSWSENNSGKAVLTELSKDYTTDKEIYMRGNQIFTYKPITGRVLEAQVKGKYLIGEKAKSNCCVTFGIASDSRWEWNSDEKCFTHVFLNPWLEGLSYDKNYQYPLVKYGTRIWTRENYNGNVPHGASKLERYGSRIEKGEAFFTFKSLAKASFPQGWHAAKTADYQELKDVLLSDGMKNEVGKRLQEGGAAGFQMKWNGWYTYDYRRWGSDCYFYHHYSREGNGTAVEYLLPGKGHVCIRSNKFDIRPNETNDWAMNIRLVMDL